MLLNDCIGWLLRSSHHAYGRGGANSLVDTLSDIKRLIGKEKKSKVDSLQCHKNDEDVSSFIRAHRRRRGKCAVERTDCNSAQAFN